MPRPRLRAPARWRAEFFLKLKPHLLSWCQSAGSFRAMPNSLARRSQSSAKVRSGCLEIQSRMSPSTGAMRETRLPPCARLLVLPLSSKTLLHQVDPGTAHLKSLGYINWSITTFQCPNHSISQILGIALHRTSPSQSPPKCHYSDQPCSNMMSFYNVNAINNNEIQFIEFFCIISFFIDKRH